MSQSYRAVITACLLIVSATVSPASAADHDAEQHESHRYIGLTYGSSGLPYIGSERGLWMFPLFRTFDDSSITNDLIISREGTIGLRWNRDNGFSVGVLARLQSLGFRASDNPSLAGMSNRHQTLEMGPFIGWRGDRIHVDLAVYGDVLDQHAGHEIRLVVSAPFQVAHKFLILHLDVYQQSEEMSDYYFGVLPSEAAPGRPAYAPGSSINFALGVRTGWHFGKRIAVFLDAGVDFYSDAIKASPIVDSGHAWNISIGAGYDF